MAYLDHDLGPEGTTRSPERPIQRTAAQSPVLDLQRLAGNAAVSQAMKSGSFAPTTIQREGEDEEDKMGEEEAGGEEAGGEEAPAEDMDEGEKEEE